MLLADVLGKSEMVVSKAINRLEDLAGGPSEDLRLLTENKRLINQKIQDLGLDPADTTGHELYQALLSKYQADNQTIDRIIGITDDSTFAEKVSKATALAKQVIGQPEVWALRPNIAKQILNDLPPKKTMKQLHYRSLDSLLKRNDVAMILLLAPVIESKKWQSDYNHQLKKLSAAAYVMRPLHIVEPPMEKLPASSSDTLISLVGGSVALWPSHDSNVLYMTLQLLEAVENFNVSLNFNLTKIHPILKWWAENDDLVSKHEDGVVSLNIYDVSVNSDYNINFDDRQTIKAPHNLWQKLANRYRDYSDEISQILPEIEAELGNVKESTTNHMPSQLDEVKVEA